MGYKFEIIEIDEGRAVSERVIKKFYKKDIESLKRAINREFSGIFLSLGEELTYNLDKNKENTWNDFSPNFKRVYKASKVGR